MNLRAPRPSIQSAFPITPIAKYSLVEQWVVRFLVNFRHCSGGQISHAVSSSGLDFSVVRKGLFIVRNVVADTEVHHAYGKNRAEKPGKGALRI